MPDRQAYEASVADWPRLRAYAKRVARDTRKPQEGSISYTTTEYQTVEKERVRKSGPFGLFTRRELTSQQQPVTRRIGVVGGHWALDRRNYHIERNTRLRGGTHQEITYEQHTFLLLPDGALKHVVLWEEEVMHVERGVTSAFVKHSHSVVDVGDSQLRSFDFEKTYAEHGTHGRGTKTWGDREPGRRLLVHARGVGLSLALKRLL
ncbi:hypothetical protein JOD64_005721 [Micromonospora luteifusca]|uniref:Uncharacterized protein n=1 Tax=Micromonospora luteifusca TaxID=709860 RepID=A0ABS2M2Z6_9ACTN|nr:hypothetical protein [Micromonospora luteifusca]MBM7494499.1 hypothetical protein [Micromonospora luteifusca]